MPTDFIVPLDEIDLSHVQYDMDFVRQYNAQRFEMEHLNGIAKLDMDAGIVIGFKDVRDDEFWVRGHIPGRPLLPGVIIVEAAAQLSTFYYMMATPKDGKFLGFAGLDKVKFRGTVAPGDRLILLGRCTELRVGRRAIFDTQAVVNGSLVYEGVIIGMPIR